MLRISYDQGSDTLWALRPDVVIDGHPDDACDQPLAGFYIYRRGPGGLAIGFCTDEASEWDVMECADESLWGADDLAFDVPTLGLRAATIGEIILCARSALDESTPDIVFFQKAVAAGGDENLERAETMWRRCLAAGDLKAHFGLGYTLVGLDRPHEAFGHLVTYTELTPELAWGWSWRGQAALAMGDVAEARMCFERAVEIEEDGSSKSNAGEWLDKLDDED